MIFSRLFGSYFCASFNGSLVTDLKAEDFLLIVETDGVATRVLLASGTGFTTRVDLLSCFLGGWMRTSIILTDPSQRVISAFLQSSTISLSRLIRAQQSSLSWRSSKLDLWESFLRGRVGLFTARFNSPMESAQIELTVRHLPLLRTSEQSGCYVTAPDGSLGCFRSWIIIMAIFLVTIIALNNGNRINQKLTTSTMLACQSLPQRYTYSPISLYPRSSQSVTLPKYHLIPPSIYFYLPSHKLFTLHSNPF